MTDRNSNYGADFSLDDMTKSGDAPVMDVFATDLSQDGSQSGDALAGERPLVRLTKRPTLTPVPRPHNAAALANSVFATSNLPVMNVHARTRKLEVAGRR